MNVKLYAQAFSLSGKGSWKGPCRWGSQKMEAMIRIIIPQAVKNILPVIGNEFVTLIKESSQVSVIGMADLMYTATTVQGISFQPFPPLVIVAALLFCHYLFCFHIAPSDGKKMNIKSAREKLKGTVLCYA